LCKTGALSKAICHRGIDVKAVLPIAARRGCQSVWRAGYFRAPPAQLSGDGEKSYGERSYRMTELASGWEIVSFRTNNRLRGLLTMALQIVLTAENGIYSSVTWTVRETSTGAIRKVTARSEVGARQKIAQNLFDPN
jgi:hypothetical protein